MARVGVKIMPREVILDTQGRAVEHTLKQNGSSLGACRIGRYVELDYPEMTMDDALAEAKKATEFVLYNSLIENFELIPLAENSQ